MPESSPNYGIQQSGGVSNVGNQAVGPHARAISHGLRFTASPATGELVTELRTLLERHRAELPDAVGEAAEELRDELDSAEPDRGVVARALERITIMVRPVAPLVETVGELTKAVDSAFGR
ncbi:hypothetical protein SAMN04488074_102154 [Lentzea albidocapillata subsp. violacea]|uniref:Uncharacterized protein n=1 Tax=Lentzea albidocapillata subsp. violacea TaxID=128104 RepID=A0A1G8U1V1_9PSEU|nr:DUF5955 family protein [Lentzea albidocapillata]SDJ47604.1 hypothetical protein SAMN04488074_102154 [Lentzea albidocapillata subsp. violacea]